MLSLLNYAVVLLLNLHWNTWQLTVPRPLVCQQCIVFTELLIFFVAVSETSGNFEEGVALLCKSCCSATCSPARQILFFKCMWRLKSKCERKPVHFKSHNQNNIVLGLSCSGNIPFKMGNAVVHKSLLIVIYLERERILETNIKGVFSRVWLSCQTLPSTAGGFTGNAADGGEVVARSSGLYFDCGWAFVDTVQLRAGYDAKW